MIKNRKKRKKPWRILSYVVLIGGILAILLPLYVTVVTALKTPEESAKSFFALPESFYLGNFNEVIEGTKFFRYTFNSVFNVVVCVALILVIAPMLSYALARNRHIKIYKFLYFYIVMGIFVPFQIIMVPLAKMMTKLDMLNLGGLIIVTVSFGLIQSTFLYVGYFSSIPKSLEEAAYVDGCSTWRCYFSIILPLAKPMTATVIVVNALWIWNDFLLPLIILNSNNDNWTVPLFQFNFKSQYTFDYNLAFASFVLTMVPIVILYIFMQKWIIAGLVDGAVKS